MISAKLVSIIEEMSMDISKGLKEELNLLDTDAFNVFYVQNETKGNELVTISNFLMRKHDLFS